MDEAKEEIQQLEEDPPEKLEDWPDGQAKYETFGGAEGDHSYAEGPETNLGPDSVRHHEDGSVEVGGEEVDDPDEFKGEPIPGGPTDPDAKDNPDAQRLSEEDGEKRGRGELAGGWLALGLGLGGAVFDAVGLAAARRLVSGTRRGGSASARRVRTPLPPRAPPRPS